jgi:hypothetical protein
MAFLSLNDYTIKVVNETPIRKLERRGREGRSFRGILRDARRGIRRGWDMEACFLDFEEAEGLLGLIEGRGHKIACADGLQASTGLNPEPGHQRVRLSPALTTPFGGLGRISVDSSLTGEIILQYDAQFDDNCWTVHWWELNGSTWEHHAKRSDGVGYLDGVQDNTVGNFGGSSEFVVDVTGGVVTFSMDDGGTETFDDLILLPYLASKQQIAAWAVAPNPFGPLPVLRARGDFIQESHIYVLGEVTGIRYVQKPQEITPFGWLNNAKIISFRLLEVADAYVFDTDVPGIDPNELGLQAGPNIPEPLAYWTFDDVDTFGGVLNDAVSNNDATLIDSPTTGVTGQIAEAYTFSGTAHLDIGNVADLNFSKTDPFSLVAWVKTSSAANQQIISKYEFPSSAGWQFTFRAGGTVEMALTDALFTGNRIQVATTAMYNDGAWHHVAMTYDGSVTAAGITLYVDSVAQAVSVSSDNDPGSINNSVNAEIGSRGAVATETFQGDMDDAGAWDVELSAANVVTIYQLGVLGARFY